MSGAPRTPEPLFFLPLAVLIFLPPLAVLIAVPLQLLMLVWRRFVYVRIGGRPRRLLGTWVVWYLVCVAVGSSSANATGLIGAICGTAWAVLSGAERLSVQLVGEAVSVGHGLGLVGVGFGFLSLVIPVLSPLVVLSWERVVQHHTPRFSNDSIF